MATKVRRAPSGGLNVRNSAAGTKIVTLNEGDLMYDIAGVSQVTKSLNGTSYVWVKVHYYCSSTKPATEGDGWVTTKHATAISTTSPTAATTYFSNSYLLQYKMLTNARYIYNYLKNENWSDNAIFAVLGNMESESNINPGIWNELDSTNTDNAYGLVQWKPSTKLTDWLNTKKLNNCITNQLERILYEVKNSKQWQSKKHSPTMTFSAFTTSKKSCDALTEYFLKCYEAPGNESDKLPERKANAAKWKKLIGYLE